MATQKEKILKLINENNGTITARQVTEFGIPRIYLSELIKDNSIEKISRGLYALPQTFVDEMYEISVRCPLGVFSHNSALYIYDLTDRTPLKYTITLPAGYNAKHLSNIQMIEMKFSTRKLYSLGITIQKSPSGFPIKVYDKEKTICDIVRNKKEIDIQVFSDAMKRYAKGKEKDLSKLMEYAKKMRIEKKMREYMEVLL